MTTYPNIPTMKYSLKKRIDVNKGLGKNWQRFFEMDDVYIPEGWVHALSINNTMYSFSFVNMYNSKKISNGSYIVVSKGITKTTEGIIHNEDTYYILRVMDVLKPSREEGEYKTYHVDEYLEQFCLTTFQESIMRDLVKRKLISVR